MSKPYVEPKGYITKEMQKILDKGAKAPTGTSNKTTTKTVTQKKGK